MALVDQATVIRKGDFGEHDLQVDALVAALRSGAHPSTAAAYAGIAANTLARWVNEGRSLAQVRDAVAADPNDTRVPSPAELDLINLAQRVDHAIALSELTSLQVIESAQEDDWRAAAWLLERRHKERWSPRAEVTGANGGALQIDDVTERRQVLLEALDKVKDRLERAESMVTEGRAEVIEMRRDDGGRGDQEDRGDRDAGVGTAG